MNHEWTRRNTNENLVDFAGTKRSQESFCVICSRRARLPLIRVHWCSFVVFRCMSPVEGRDLSRSHTIEPRMNTDEHRWLERSQSLPIALQSSLIGATSRGRSPIAPVPLNRCPFVFICGFQLNRWLSSRLSQASRTTGSKRRLNVPTASAFVLGMMRCDRSFVAQMRRREGVTAVHYRLAPLST